jgi:probable rRNA maturation factor
LTDPAVDSRVDSVVDLVVEDAAWTEAVPDLAAVAETAARLALEAGGLDPARWSICILACDDARIAELNREFRGKPAATNVLSWPAFALAPRRPGSPPPAPPAPSAAPVPPAPSAAPAAGRGGLGDVAIALQSTRREAEAAAMPLKDHVIHLILHGCLHLLGFDHETDEDAAAMEEIETGALARVGVSDPYGRDDAARPCPDR